MSRRDDEETIAPKQINKTESRQLALLLHLIKYKNGLTFSKIRAIMPEFYNNENIDSDKKKVTRDIEELSELGFAVKQLEAYYASGHAETIIYKLEENPKERKLQFSKQELETLSLVILQYYHSHASAALRTATQKLFASELNFFPELTDSAENPDMEQSPEAEILYKIIKCIRNQVPIRVEYYKNDPDNKEWRFLEPYEIVKRNSLDFYLVAYDRDKKAKRKFLIPKITTVQAQSGTFVTRPKVTAEDKNYHPLSFTLHSPETIELECLPEMVWKLEKFIYPHAYTKKENRITLTTTNRSALYSFLWKESPVLRSTSSEKLRQGFREFMQDLQKKYETPVDKPQP
ncbi:MAG: WYL domain-containing protein [Spirochaetota bacterium]